MSSSQSNPQIPFYKGGNGVWPIVEAITTERNRGHSLRDKDWMTHCYGVTGEIVYANFFNVMPDMNVYQKNGMGPMGDPGFDITLGYSNDLRTQIKVVLGPDVMEKNIGSLKDIDQAPWELFLASRIHLIDGKPNEKSFEGFRVELLGWITKTRLFRVVGVRSKSKDCVLHFSCLSHIDELRTLIRNGWDGKE